MDDSLDFDDDMLRAIDNSMNDQLATIPSSSVDVSTSKMNNGIGSNTSDIAFNFDDSDEDRRLFD